MEKSRKILITISFLTIAVLVGLPTANAQVTLLAPLSNEASKTVRGLPEYLHYAFPILIRTAITLAVVMITIGAIQYMFSGVPGAKGEGLKRIKEAIWGLLLALTAYLILNTINPRLVSLDFDLENLNSNPTTSSGD